MLKKGASLAFKLSLVGSILIFLNGVWIAVNGAPIIVATDPTLTTLDAVEKSRVFWGRISFGIKGMVEGLGASFWLIFTIALLWCTIQTYRKPRRHRSLGILIIVFSILSLPIGGGFIAGLILAFVGGMLAMEWPKPFGETFIGKMARIAKLDSKAIGELYNDPRGLRSGIWVLVFVSFVMGLGSAIYVFNVNIIKTKPTAAYDMLILGKLNIDLITILYSVSFIGIVFLRWLILSSVLYGVLVKLKGHTGDFSKLSHVTAFAFVPLCLHWFLPFLFSNEPYRSFHWPFVITLFSILWIAVAVMAIVKSTFDTGTREALGVTIFAGVLFWFIDNLLIMTNPFITVPGVSFKFDPGSSSAVILFFSLAVLLATVFGAFGTERSS